MNTLLCFCQGRRDAQPGQHGTRHVRNTEKQNQTCNERRENPEGNQGAGFGDAGKVRASHASADQVGPSGCRL